MPKDFYFLLNNDPAVIEQIYRQYRENPEQVDTQWRMFFSGFEFGQSAEVKGMLSGVPTEHIQKEIKVLHLIDEYRRRGHLFTKTNPVRKRRPYFPTLDIEHFGLEERDLDTVFQAGEEIGLGPATLREIIDHLQTTYCRSIGAEYMYIRIPWRIRWLQKRMESSRNLPQFTPDDKKHILRKLNQAVVFENFLHTKYIGQKRFALSGGETLIPGLEFLIEKAADLGTEEIVIGMAHRGRLNVLANVMNKTYEEIFREFEPIISETNVFAGDVKYHIGFTSKVRTRFKKEVIISLSHNPSHLEAVTPVATGLARAKIDKKYHHDPKKVLPVIIHGDAAIAGQGVVYETVQMSQLNGYHTGGTIHIVINNQLGFTTNYLEGRSSTYCTDVAKVILAPVFHVNADDAEAVVYVMQLAMEYRQLFHSDVFIDLLGYRRYGHNESDEPRYTQPKLYKIIEKHPDPRQIYIQQLMQSNAIDRKIAEQMEQEYRDLLQKRLEEIKKHTEPFKAVPDKDPEYPFIRDEHYSFEQYPDTGVESGRLLQLGTKIFSISEEYSIFPKIRRLYQERLEKVKSGKNLDWGTAELLAYATLLDEGIPVRISGQDSKRGTFSHRQAVLYNEETEDEFVPLNHIQKDQAPFYIYNSPLSEYGVLAFEYGYAYGRPEALVIWEAQFGDFTNGAQIVVDEFISSAESKWNKLNGIVLYLPHGYEGQGADHSSARIERFMTLCANNNMHVAYPSTPANFFHLLRLHMKMPFRIPLVIFTPKSLLRHPACVSTLDELAGGSFQPVIDDQTAQPEKIHNLILCTGKIYYELDQFRKEQEITDTAIIRVEQLYPYPQNLIRQAISRYPNARNLLWVQEEPINMGYWPFIKQNDLMPEAKVVARPANSAPATGFFAQHQREQEQLILSAFERSIRTSKKGSKKKERTQS